MLLKMVFGGKPWMKFQKRKFRSFKLTVAGQIDMKYIYLIILVYFLLCFPINYHRTTGRVLSSLTASLRHRGLKLNFFKMLQMCSQTSSNRRTQRFSVRGVWREDFVEPRGKTQVQFWLSAVTSSKICIPDCFKTVLCVKEILLVSLTWRTGFGLGGDVLKRRLLSAPL